MRALIDTCVLSELRRHGGAETVRARLAKFAEEDLFISVLTLGEISKGLERLPSGEKRRSLAGWLDGLEPRFAGRILPVDPETARLWGEITGRVQNMGIILPAVDGLIAATAIRHGLHVLTRNVRHFEASGVPLIDPWTDEAV